MNTPEEILEYVRPSRLVFFEEDVPAADGTPIGKAGTIGAIRLQSVDSYGTGIEVFDSPNAKKRRGMVTENDLVGKIRPASADEERAWLTLGAVREESEQA